MSDLMPIYSFVIPIYNDGDLADDFCTEMKRVFTQLRLLDSIDEELELIFVDDGSANDSWEHLLALRSKYPFARLIRLSRNFGQHIALSCGYRHARGRIIGMLNVDMEDPPDQIPLLLDEIEKGGHNIVFGTRAKRKSPLMVKLSSRLFNWTLNKLTGYDVPYNIATLRVMDRKFLDAYNSLSEKSRYIPGLEMWFGFSRGYVPIRHQIRTRGHSSYSFRKRLSMATDTILSFSDLPLRIVSMLGFLIALGGFVAVLALVILQFFFIDFRPGYASSIATIIFIGGVQIFCIGLASQYIGRILKEVQNRPLYVVQESVGIDEKSV